MIAGVEEHDDAEDRDDQERDAHADLGSRVNAAEPDLAEGEPMHDVCGEPPARLEPGMVASKSFDTHGPIGPGL